MHLVICIGIALIPAIVQAEIFKCIDPSGKTVFRDSECRTNETLEKTIDTDALRKQIAPKALDFEDGGSPGNNLLTNASFEEKLTGWKVPLGVLWTSNGGVNDGGALTIKADKPPDDKYIHETVAEQCVLLGDGDKFTITAEFRSSKTPLKAYANRANVIWYESTDCSTGGQWGTYLEPERFKSGWQKLTRSNLTPALGARAAKITLVQKGRYSDGGRGFWDNLVFTATRTFTRSEDDLDESGETSQALKPGDNFLHNGAFHQDVSAWRPGWKTVWSGLHGNRYPGSAEVMAESERGSIGRGALNQCVAIGAYSKFRLGASFKRYEASTQRGSGRLRVTWYGNRNCTGPAKTDTNSTDPTDTQGWQELRIANLVAPPNSLSARIEIIQSVLGKGQFMAYWDDVYFEAIE